MAFGSGTLAAVFLLLSVCLSIGLVPVAAGGNLGLVDTLRELGFLAGGPVHIPLLGLFTGVASIAALRGEALPRWISWIGISAATLSLLSLTSLLWFPATFLLPLGQPPGRLSEVLRCYSPVSASGPSCTLAAYSPAA